MDILALTTTESVRVAIGVDDTEITDTQFTELNISDDLEIDMFSWFPQWKTLMADNSDDDIIELQKKSIKSYAKWFVAVWLFAGANLRFLQRKSDGEVESHRFNQKNLEDQRAELIRLKEIAKARALELTTDFTPTNTSGKFTQFVRATANRDVVTE